MKNLLILMFLVLLTFVGCSPKKSFDEQVTDDLISAIKEGRCDKISPDARITDIVIGEATPIGETSLVDVEASFHFEDKNNSGKMIWAFLYIQKGENRIMREVGTCKIE